MPDNTTGPGATDDQYGGGPLPISGGSRDALAKIFGDILGFGPGIAGAITSGNIQQWIRAAIINVFNNQRQGQGFQQGQYQNTFDPLRDALLGNNNAMSAFQFPTQGGSGNYSDLNAQAGDWQNQIQQLFKDSGSYWTPQQGQAQAGIQGLLGKAGGPTDIASSLFGSSGMGGQTGGQVQNILDRLSEIGNGQGWQMGQMATTGGDLLGQYGVNGFTQGLKDRADTTLNQGGWTPQLNSLASAGQSGLDKFFGTTGLTPTGAVGEGVGLQGLLQGGQTPSTNALQGYGTSQATQEPLLSMPEVINFARQEASRNVQKNAEQAQRLALARGGGPGSITSAGVSGPQTLLMKEFADQSADQESQAVRDALMKQQGLQLQRQAQGAQMANQAGTLENQRLGTFGDLLKNLEDVASRRYGIGGSLLGNANQLAIQNQGQMGNLGLGSAGLELSRMTEGGNLLNAFNQLRLNGLSQGGQLVGQQQNYGTSSGDLLNKLLSTQGGMNNDIFNQMLGAGTLGMNRANDIGGIMNQMFGNRINLGGQGLDFLSRNQGTMAGLAQNANDVWSRIMGNEVGLFGTPRDQSSWATFAGQLT